MTTSSTAFDPTGLSRAEQLLIAGELIHMAAHPQPPLTASQIAELERLDADADAGVVQGTPWTIVRERLKSRA